MDEMKPGHKGMGTLVLPHWTLSSGTDLLLLALSSLVALSVAGALLRLLGVGAGGAAAEAGPRLGAQLATPATAPAEGAPLPPPAWWGEGHCVLFMVMVIFIIHVSELLFTAMCRLRPTVPPWQPPTEVYILVLQLGCGELVCPARPVLPVHGPAREAQVPHRAEAGCVAPAVLQQRGGEGGVAAPPHTHPQHRATPSPLHPRPHPELAVLVLAQNVGGLTQPQVNIIDLTR